MKKSGFKFGEKFGYESPLKTIQVQQQTAPTISLKCPNSPTKIKVNCIVEVYFKLSGSSGWSWGFDYLLELSSSDSNLVIYDKSFDLDNGWTFIAQMSNPKKSSSSLDMNVNGARAASFKFEFVTDKSAFTRTDKTVIVDENSGLVGLDKVCFRVADKAIAKLLNDKNLVLKSYNGLSGFSRMDDYKAKGYIYKSKKFDQKTIWRRHSESGYNLVPYEFSTGQMNCFSSFVKDTATCMGIHVYHFILLDGYHVLILLVDNTNSCKTTYKIMDQLKHREWEDLANLDKGLLEMTRNNYPGACNYSNRKDINSSINLCKIQSK